MERLELETELRHAVARNELRLHYQPVVSLATGQTEAVEALLRTPQHEFPVVDDAGRVLGVLTRDDIITALKRHGPGAPVREFMRRDLPVLSVHEPFEEAFRSLQSASGRPAWRGSWEEA